MLLIAVGLLAQSATKLTLKGQVIDPSGATVPGATVTLQSAGAAPRSSVTDTLGRFSFAGVASGNYDVTAKKKGFAVYQVQAYPITADSTMDIQLAVEAAAQELTVSDDRAHVEVDPDRNGSALVLKGTDLDSLSDDPDQLESDLEALAGPSAGPNGGQIYIDGFSSGRLPPKAAIREIRVNSNPFSAEYDRLGYGRVEIFTKPGMDQLRGSVMTMFSDNAMNANNPFLSTVGKPGFQQRSFNANLGGRLTKKSSFTFDFERRDIDDFGVQQTVQLDSSFVPTRYTGFVPAPTMRMEFNPKIDIALSDRHTLSTRYEWSRNTRDNQGVSDFALASRGTNYVDTENLLQVTETAILSTKAVTETRFQYRHQDVESTPISIAPAITVSDSFSSGGSGAGHTFNTTNNYEVSSVTTYTAGKHTIKFGGRERTVSLTDNSPTGFNGSFSFVGGLAPQLDSQFNPVLGPDGNPVMAAETSIERYRRTLLMQQRGFSPATIQSLGGGASQFTITGGNPLATLNQTDIGVFATDDWRLRPSFTLSLGLRYEAQTNYGSLGNFAPRVGWAWAIGGGKNRQAKTVLRGGAGFFYDRIGTGVSLATMRLNGVTQTQYVVRNPLFFPDVPTLDSLAASAQPSSVTKVYSGLVNPRIAQTGLSVERQLPRNTVVSATWAFSRGMHYLITRNINAPTGTNASGAFVYPFGNPNQLMLYESAGLFTQNQLIVNANTRFSRRVSLFGFYTLGSAHGDSDATPVNQYDLSSEWAPTRFDVRHRAFFGGSITAPYKLMLSPFVNASSGAPYNITTGADYLGSEIFNARPSFATDANAVGVKNTPYGLMQISPAPGDKIIPRNYGRAPGQFGFNMRVARTWGFGKSKDAAANTAQGGHQGGGPGGFAGMGGRGPGGPGGGGMRGGGGGMFGGGDSGKRFNLTLSVSARNLFNYVNRNAPNGNLSSQLFGTYTSLASGFGGGTPVYNRRIDLQLRLSF